jgi:hypothetical protein
MNWLAWLGLAVIIGVVAAVTGFKPKGTRHVAGTRLMGIGRFVLLVMLAIFRYLAWRAHGGAGT